MPNNNASTFEKFSATWQFLTIYPAPKGINQAPPHLVMMPLVGLALGLILFCVSTLFSTAPPFTTALLVLLLWLISTGFLHLDGVADLADGLGAAHKGRQQLLAVMKDSDIGAFAIISLILIILSKFALLTSLALNASWLALLLIPAWARLGAAWWITCLPPLHEEDSLATWCKQSENTDLTPWFVILLLLSLLLQPILLLAPILLWAWQNFLRHKLKGMNGDCLGAGIEVCETTLLLLCCLSL